MTIPISFPPDPARIESELEQANVRNYKIIAALRQRIITAGTGHAATEMLAQLAHEKPEVLALSFTALVMRLALQS